MVDINEEIKKIKSASFFENMGVDNIHESDVILIGSVRQVFIEPSGDDFKGLYKETEWLPTSPTQNDPFYEKQVSPKELIELRKEINKCIAKAITDATGIIANNDKIHPWIPRIIPDIFLEIEQKQICIEFHHTNRDEPGVIADYVLKKLNIYMNQLEEMVTSEGGK